MPLFAAFAATVVSACDAAEKVEFQVDETVAEETLTVSPENVARLMAEIPLTRKMLEEVHEAVTASSANGYDEEYTFGCMVSSPGSGVGDDRLAEAGPASGNSDAVAETKAQSGDDTGCGLWAAVEDKLSSAGIATRSGGSFAEELSASGLQIYWPYSEDWDRTTVPVITFNPGDGSSSNVGFIREDLPDGSWIIKELVVDEDYAMSHPVWVINWNEDRDYLTPQVISRLNELKAQSAGQGVKAAAASAADFKTLVLKDFKAHRTHDSWFAGASEYFVKCGSIEGFDAETDDELKLYSPSVSDMLIVIKRKQVGKYVRFNSVLVSEWTSQLEECALLVVEDDGGKQTSWKATGVVKIKSKSYGFEIELPFNRNDDIIWRGSLSRNFVEKYSGEAQRYGDVSIIMDLV